MGLPGNRNGIVRRNSGSSLHHRLPARNHSRRDRIPLRAGQHPPEKQLPPRILLRDRGHHQLPVRYRQGDRGSRNVRAPLLPGERSRILGGPPRPPHRGPAFPGKALLPDRPRGDRRSFRESRFHGPRLGCLVRPDLRGVVLPVPGGFSHAQRSRHHERRRLRQAGIASLHPRADETPLGPCAPGRNPPASLRFRETRLDLLFPRPVDAPLQSPILRPSARKRDPPLPPQRGVVQPPDARPGRLQVVQRPVSPILGRHRPAGVRRHPERLRAGGRHGGAPRRGRIRHPPAGREHGRGAGPGAAHHPAVPAAPAAGGQGIPHRAAVGQRRRGVVPLRLLRQGRPGEQGGPRAPGGQKQGRRPGPHLPRDRPMPGA